MIAALAAGIAISACGSGGQQAATEPTGNFQVSATADWITSQRLSQHTVLTITLTNTGTKAIPKPAVTLTDTTPSGDRPAPAFQTLLKMPGLANQARPVWAVDRAPDPPGPSQGKCPQNAVPGNADPNTYTGPNYSSCVGGPGGAVTAYANTWAMPNPLTPGKSVKFVWRVTAVQSGTYVVNWQVGAGLNGKSKAVSASGGPPRGAITVTIGTAPQQAYVTNGGQIVNTP
jgi:hypothetical protein